MRCSKQALQAGFLALCLTVAWYYVVRSLIKGGTLTWSTTLVLMVDLKDRNEDICIHQLQEKGLRLWERISVLNTKGMILLHKFSLCRSFWSLSVCQFRAA